MYTDREGARINVDVAGSGRPLLLLHGFTGSSATWLPLQRQIGDGYRTIAVDAIGHGRSDSPADAERYRMERCVADLLGVLDALGVAHCDVLGHSMGARTALQLCAAAPERVDRLVLESGSPGMATAAERAARITADEALAAAIECDGLPAFVARWESQPLFASQQALPAAEWEAQRAQRLQNDPVGLANSLRGSGTGRQTSLWPRLATIDRAALLIAGALDAKYCSIAEQMAAALPRATVSIVVGAGHTVHLEQPEQFRAALLAFLDTPIASPAGAG